MEIRQALDDSKIKKLVQNSFKILPTSSNVCSFPSLSRPKCILRILSSFGVKVARTLVVMPRKSASIAASSGFETRLSSIQSPCYCHPFLLEPQDLPDLLLVS